MKKLTSNQKSVIHGGSSIVGIVQGFSAFLTCVSMVLEITSEYIMESKNSLPRAKTKYSPYGEGESRTFSNEIERKNTILS